jgi:hypothetical protein
VRSTCGLVKEKLVDCFSFSICIGLVEDVYQLPSALTLSLVEGSVGGSYFLSSVVHCQPVASVHQVLPLFGPVIVKI